MVSIQGDLDAGAEVISSEISAEAKREMDVVDGREFGGENFRNRQRR